MKKILSGIIMCLLSLSIFTIILPPVDAGPTPSISVNTTTDKINAQVGDVVTYTFEVTNTGKVTLFNVKVSGDIVGPGTNPSESGRRANSKLEPGETWAFTASYTIVAGDPDPLVNIATATADTRKGVMYTATYTNSIFIYGKTGDVLPDVLTSPNQEPNGGWYGCSVAVGEGLIVVGAAYESLPNPLYNPDVRKQTEPMQIYGAGRVYIYHATTGVLLETLTSPNPTSPGWFGYSVAVGDGVIVVGAPKETSGGVTLSGNAYVYDAVTYGHLDTFTTPNPVSDDNGYGYGTSVAVNDGIIAIGSSWEIVSDITGAGRVYLYNVVDGTALSFSPLVTPDPQEYGRFGIAVAIGEGAIVVGAAYEDINIEGSTIEGAGRVYIYNAVTGEPTDTDVSLNPEFAGHFGFSVAIGDGQIVIGAFDETVGGNDEAGRAYIYDLTSETITHTLVSRNSQYRGLFGNSVAVGDGFVVVGAIIENSGIYPDAGNAYVFNTGTGAPIETLTNPSPADWTEFGWSVAVGAGVIAVGAYDAVFIVE